MWQVVLKSKQYLKTSLFLKEWRFFLNVTHLTGTWCHCAAKLQGYNIWASPDFPMILIVCVWVIWQQGWSKSWQKDLVQMLQRIKKCFLNYPNVHSEEAFILPFYSNGYCPCFMSHLTSFSFLSWHSAWTQLLCVPTKLVMVFDL